VVYELLSWMTSKEVIETVLQVLLFLATCGLIVVGIFQARAAMCKRRRQGSKPKLPWLSKKRYFPRALRPVDPFSLSFLQVQA
jgi:hypothetical protein